MFAGLSLSLILAASTLVTMQAESGSLIRYVSHKNCNNMARGKIIPNPVNCSQYIMCNGLRSTLGECPEGSYYNADMRSCDKGKTQCPAMEMGIVLKPTVPSNIKGPEKLPINITNRPPPPKPAVTTQQPATSPALPLYIDGRPLCSLWQDLQFPHPYNCSYYYQCFKGFLTIRRCISGYIWDWMAQRCLPETVGQCPSIRSL